MKNTIAKLLGLSLLAMTSPAFAAMGEEPVVSSLMMHKFETDDSGQQVLRWDGQFWLGRDLNKFMLKSEGERSRDGTEEFEIQALYSRAIAPFWDLQAGIRHDLKPEPTQNWGVITLQGLAPYFFETDISLFVGESGNTALRLNGEYELLLTQRLILSPRLEVNLYGKDMPELETGTGLADIEAGLRLRYEIRREFAPYLGLNWYRLHGRTADYARMNGEADSDTSVVAGIRFWF